MSLILFPCRRDVMKNDADDDDDDWTRACSQGGNCSMLQPWSYRFESCAKI